jgi:UDP-galactopyranose mutase
MEGGLVRYDVLVVGAGFAGAVVAERLAVAGKLVLVIDKREHVGGNAYDEYDQHGVLVHRYGPHIFHTNAKRIIEYLSRFTHWRFYEHRVKAVVNNRAYPMPINRKTINDLYGLRLDEQGVAEFLGRAREERAPIKTSEDVILNSVGRDLYEKFYLNYTRKQWGLEPSQLSAGVAARIPVRTDDDDRYFTDQYQLMPSQGYSKMFGAILQHNNIDVQLGQAYAAIREKIDVGRVVYTGPIDAYFDYCYGKLPYRSLRFEHQHIQETALWQDVGTINYPNDNEFTRITEFKHLTGQDHPGTSIVREYPRSEGEPYYPIPTPENEALYKRYAEIASAATGVTFVGRLAQYRYYNMDQVVGAALKAAQTILESE